MTPKSTLSSFNAVLLAAVIAACATPSAPTTSTSPTVLPISMSDLRRDLQAFAADSFLGRETGTASADKAARFIAERLMALGVEPAGDSLYFQRVPMVRETFASSTRIMITQGQSSSPLTLGVDITPLVNLGEGAPLPKRHAEGDLVFAGYGLTAADFQAVRDAGKVIVMLHGAPATVTDSAERDSLESANQLSQRIGNALQFRPVAIVLLMTAGARDFYAQAIPEVLRAVTLSPGDQTTSDSQRPLPMVLLGLANPGSLLLPNGWPGDESGQALDGRRFTANVEIVHQPFTAYNVVGVVRGSDSMLNKTYVAFGAHYDHIGVQPGMTPDSIANGADDDGSGSMAMLGVAKSMMASRPRRSALFVWHVGEEKGLLGSEYFTDHPTVPIDSIVAQLNADMIGRNGGPTSDFDTRVSGAAMVNKLYVVGPNAAPNGQSRVLGAILDSVNARQVHPFDLDHEWDSMTHPEHIYNRSDHYNYARKGIPIVFFTTGLHEDYHKVSDESQKIDYAKLTRVASLFLELGTTLGNRTSRPR